ncbi:hypothetical protein NDU88_005571 [Pleurodeles waltl]|uniref:Uncharacterized protein n=1 Tax=Pleurodeles waltl TaxID=8319 RepID=A0AAV7M9Q4_PLEWA|nr:hypothetical protein NDU88_005571 [Pleurodeles waltl]
MVCVHEGPTILQDQILTQDKRGKKESCCRDSAADAPASSTQSARLTESDSDSKYGSQETASTAGFSGFSDL